MIVNDAPETSQGGSDNMHDLLAEYPWLLNPEWQVLIEEKSISRILQDWNLTETEDTEARRRIDFLALTDERRLIIVEIKRAGHPVSLKELQRLEKYKDDLSKGDDRELSMLLVHGGTINVSAPTLKSWKDREDGSIVEWRSLYSRTLRYYQHYEAVLTGEVEDPGFSRKEREVVRTRTVLETGTVHRGPEIRRQGLGSQDVNYLDTAKPSPEAVAQPPQDED